MNWYELELRIFETRNACRNALHMFSRLTRQSQIIEDAKVDVVSSAPASSKPSVLPLSRKPTTLQSSACHTMSVICLGAINEIVPDIGFEGQLPSRDL